MRDDEPRRVRPLGPPGPAPRPLPPVVLLVALAVAVGAFLATAGEESEPPRTSPERSPATAGRVGLQAGSVLWAIDIGSGEVAPFAAGALDPVPWRVTMEGRRLGEVFYLGPDGDVDLESLPGSVFAILLTGGDAIAGRPLPAALVPIWPGMERNGYDLVFARPAGGEWIDIVPLPGCGLPLPVAAPDARDVLHVWCTDIDEVRLLVEFPHGGPAGDDPPVLYEALVVDFSGALWTGLLGAETTSEPLGTLTLAAGEMVTSVSTLSRDGRILFAGIADAAQAAAPHRAHRVLAYDRQREAELWTAALPVPVESLVVGSNGTLYAYYPGVPGDPTGPASALVEIDPADGAARIIISPLDLGTGRLLRLP